MTLSPLQTEAVERLTLLAAGCDVSGLDHLPVVARENASAFAGDLRIALSALSTANAELSALRQDHNDHWAGKVAVGGEGLERLRSELAEAREALEPFARFSADRDAWAWDGKHDNAIVCGSEKFGSITRADFRRAAAVGGKET